MSTPSPQEFSVQEKQLVQTTLFERYGRIVPVQPVEVELQIDPKTPEPTTCAALYWSEGDAAFVVARMIAYAGAAPIYRAQFFYGEDEAYGTGHANYGNLGDCLVSILKVQAEHEATRTAAPTDGAAKAKAQPRITGDEDYDGPLVV
jgi:hypothetical protein